MSISRDTFDKLKHYVGVRLQQGVPLVDADWNEQEDIRRYELQAFLKWFVGNGVPEGNDGFRILPVTDETENDFIIKGGNGTAEGAGRCLVEGWDAINESNLNYKAQPLYENDDLANGWKVDRLDPLSPPDSGKRTDTVYLDVWEREVDADEDGDLVNPAIGIETCVRLKREWVVRVAEGVTVNLLPTPSDGHVYYPLAELTRESGKDRIEADDISDLRSTNVHLASAPSTTGVVVFPDSTDSLQNISDLIDPGLGPGAISVRLGLDLSTEKVIFVGHSQASDIFPDIFRLDHDVLLGALIEPQSGMFQVGIKVPNLQTLPIRVRWWAFKPRQDIGEVIVQAATGSIVGYVKNIEEELLSGATVSAGGISVTTGENGSYCLEGLPEGSYNVKAACPGYISGEITVFLTPGQQMKKNFVLTPSFCPRPF